MKKIKLFTSSSSVSRRFGVLVAKKRLRSIGRLATSWIDGPSEEYYCNRPLKFDCREHEALVMETVIAYYPHPAVTGSDVNPDYDADFEITMFDNRFYGEADMDEEGKDQIQSHFRRYPGTVDKDGKVKTPACTDQILVVTLDAHRMERLMLWLTFLGPLVYFSTIDKVMAEPYGYIWKGLDGHKYSIMDAVNAGDDEGV